MLGKHAEIHITSIKAILYSATHPSIHVTCMSVSITGNNVLRAIFLLKEGISKAESCFN